PSRVVVGFGEAVSVSCEATRPVRVLGWESASRNSLCSGKWTALLTGLRNPFVMECFTLHQGNVRRNSTLYCTVKIPDSVSIRPVDHTGPMVEAKKYQLLCEVQNIAPVQYLTLKWYRGDAMVHNHSFSDLTSSSPVQVSSILEIFPSRAENGASYRCVAELELGPEGPQQPPSVTSDSLNVSVQCESLHFGSYFLISGAEIVLNCTALGHPSPVYSWQSPSPMQLTGDEAILISSTLVPGAYICTASNSLGKKTKNFTVKAKTKGMEKPKPACLFTAQLFFIVHIFVLKLICQKCFGLFLSLVIYLCYFCLVHICQHFSAVVANYVTLYSHRK
uniref:Ig-like domain-containing protein n=1 Tax=Periophthalmus magnuspinnatus TaxID=409849 RepID=A0A3B3ZA97_9GOBI